MRAISQAIFLNLAVFLERVSYVTFLGSILTFSMSLDTGKGATAHQYFSLLKVLIFLVPILSRLALERIGDKFWMFVTASLSVVLGTVGIALGSAYNMEWLFYFSLYCIFALPLAVLKSEYLLLGSHQLIRDEEIKMCSVKRLQSATYWIINIADIVALFLFCQIAKEGMGSISQENSYTFVYVIMCIINVVAFFSLVLGLSDRRRTKGSNQRRKTFIPHVGITKVALKHKINIGHLLLFWSPAFLLIVSLISIITYFVLNDYMAYITLGFIVASYMGTIIAGINVQWLDPILEACHIDDATGVKAIYNVVPFFAILLPLWICYNQGLTRFISQGCQMNPNIYGKYSLAPSSVGGSSCLIKMVLLPVLEFLIFPAMENSKLCKRTMNQRSKIC